MIRYNPDRSADVELEFEILNSDSWPVQSLRVDFSCSGESPCDASDTFQISDEEWTNHRYVTTLYGIQTTDNELTAVFHSMSEGWNGASRTTKLDNVLPYIPEQPAIDVIWHRPSVEVRGYYLDGSAEVDITVSARQAGHLPSATVTPEAICLRLKWRRQRDLPIDRRERSRSHWAYFDTLPIRRNSFAAGRDGVAGQRRGV